MTHSNSEVMSLVWMPTCQERVLWDEMTQVQILASRLYDIFNQGEEYFQSRGVRLDDPQFTPNSKCPKPKVFPPTSQISYCQVTFCVTALTNLQDMSELVTVINNSGCLTFRLVWGDDQDTYHTPLKDLPWI